MLAAQTLASLVVFCPQDRVLISLVDRRLHKRLAPLYSLLSVLLGVMPEPKVQAVIGVRHVLVETG